METVYDRTVEYVIFILYLHTHYTIYTLVVEYIRIVMQSTECSIQNLKKILVLFKLLNEIIDFWEKILLSRSIKK